MNHFAMKFALETKKMEPYFIISLIMSLPKSNPAYLDLLKLVAGSALWFGGLVGFMYWRQYKLKSSVSQ